jgi:threonylcarbamoyladenosine tRNA methylthiotransferase MtaB
MSSPHHVFHIAFYTLGCKVNFSETSFLAGKLISENLIRVRHTEKADLYVIHSCILTSQAEKKTRNAISKSHRLNPHAKIIVIGCVSQLKAEEISKLPGVSVVAGNNTKFDLPQIIQQLLNNKQQGLQTDDVHKNPPFHISWSHNDRTRTFLKIQDGCDCYCSYCIVPFARGKSRSARAEDIIRVVEDITNAGFREIVLTGINLGDYGKDRDESLTDAISIIHSNKQIERIRISSLEPHHFTEDFFRKIQSFPKLMPHFHIPIQAGNNGTLKRMGRTYTTEDISHICNRLTELYPGVCIAADVITGFPGETEEEAENSKMFYESLPLAYLHVFTFSARKGTKAAEFEHQLHPTVKKERTGQLLALSETKKREFYHSALGQTRTLLPESDNKKGLMYGFTDNYIRVAIPWDKALVNQLVSVKLTDYCEGEGVCRGRVSGK